MASSTSSFGKSFLVTVIIFLLADILWHSVLLADFYNTRLAYINGLYPADSFPPFIFAYEIIAAGIMTYFIRVAARPGSLVSGMGNGALLGFLVSGGINFINHSLILKWDLGLTIVDTLWGVAMGAIAGAAIVWVEANKR